jgi:hypothetical protein
LRIWVRSAGVGWAEAEATRKIEAARAVRSGKDIRLSGGKARGCGLL